METERRRDGVKLSLLLREMLDETAPSIFQDTDGLDDGRRRTFREIVARKVLEAAAEGKQWAIELLFERHEGKAVQGAPDDVNSQHTDEVLNDVTRKHLNEIAGRLGGGPAPAPAPVRADADAKPAAPDDHANAARARDRAAPAARPVLDLPKDRDRGAQGLE